MTWNWGQQHSHLHQGMSVKRSAESSNDSITTLHVSNICTKAPRATLKHLLYLAFSTYGVVIAIFVRHGYAHVHLTSADDAGLAMRLLNNELILKKPMRVSWAKSETRRGMGSSGNAHEPCWSKSILLRPDSMISTDKVCAMVQNKSGWFCVSILRVQPFSERNSYCWSTQSYQLAEALVHCVHEYSFGVNWKWLHSLLSGGAFTYIVQDT